MTEAPDEPHSSERAYNGTALRHAPAIIHANKSNGAKWGRSGHWLVAPSFGMNVAYQRLDIAESRAAETERLRALLREAAEALRSVRDDPGPWVPKVLADVLAKMEALATLEASDDGE